MRKLLSVAVPCYNSAAYMGHCIETLVAGGEEMEVLVVDDGSQKDNTFEIAKEWEAKYPTIVRAIHQENKGHGGAVNTGLANATGEYFKVVDSDDWVNSEVLKKILDHLRAFTEKNEPVDMFLSNYIYDKVGVENKKVMEYTAALPTDRVLTWADVKKLPMGKYIMMHSVIYRTQILRDCGLKLPEHTFYVDNLYVYVPITKVEKLYYINENFYHYFIGRNDQSVNEKVMIGRIDQQLRVNKLMSDMVDLSKVAPDNKREYMYHYIEIITMISNVLMLIMNNEEGKTKRAELWAYIEKNNPWLYSKLNGSLIGKLAHVKTGFGRRVVLIGYTITQKIFGFN